MANHFWLFPWLALAAGAAAFFTGVGRAGVRPVPAALPPPAYLVLWLVVILGSTLACLRLGTIASVDYIAARGLILGAVGGLLVSLVCRSYPLGQSGEESPPGPPICILIGLITTMTAGARLWLTHGELSGLAAMEIGLTVSILLLGFAPARISPEPRSESRQIGAGRTPSGPPGSEVAALVLLYAVTLASGVQIGFTRAAELSGVFWADLPLLLAGALCIGLLVASEGARLTGGDSWFTLLLPPAAGAAAAGALCVGLLHLWKLGELLGLGMVAFAALQALAPSVHHQGGPADSDGGFAGRAAGFLVVVMAGTAAFSSLSGYGLALMALGGWMALGWPILVHALSSDGAIREDGGALNGATPGGAAYGLGFVAVLLVHRMLLLEAGSGIRASGPGDTWDLFAIAVGLMIPVLATAWLDERDACPGLPGWGGAIEWLALLFVPTLLAGYVLGARAVAGVVLGLALSPLVVGALLQGRRWFGGTALSSAGAALVLLEFLPWLKTLDAPTQHIRVLIILGCAAVMIVRLLIPSPPGRSGAGRRQSALDGSSRQADLTSGRIDQ